MRYNAINYLIWKLSHMVLKMQVCLGGSTFTPNQFLILLNKQVKLRFHLTVLYLVDSFRDPMNALLQQGRTWEVIYKLQSPLIKVGKLAVALCKILRFAILKCSFQNSKSLAFYWRMARFHESNIFWIWFSNSANASISWKFYKNVYPSMQQATNLNVITKRKR